MNLLIEAQMMMNKAINDKLLENKIKRFKASRRKYITVIDKSVDCTGYVISDPYVAKKYDVVIIDPEYKWEV